MGRVSKKKTLENKLVWRGATSVGIGSLLLMGNVLVAPEAPQQPPNYTQYHQLFEEFAFLERERRRFENPGVQFVTPEAQAYYDAVYTPQAQASLEKAFAINDSVMNELHAQEIEPYNKAIEQSLEK